MLLARLGKDAKENRMHSGTKGTWEVSWILDGGKVMDDFGAKCDDDGFNDLGGPLLEKVIIDVFIEGTEDPCTSSH